MYLDALSNLKQQQKSITDRKGLGDNFDMFLKLLTTQLQNQDPLNPLDTDQFTQQLTQFSTVEQSIKANANLESIVKLAAASTATAAVGFIGKTIEISNSAGKFNGTSANWNYTAAADASDATFTVRDAKGNVVRTLKRSVTQGIGTFVWDGKNNEGNVVAKGDYSLTIQAADAQGKSVDVKLTTKGVVDGVEFIGNDPMLVVGDKRIPMSAIRSVGAA